MRNIHAPERPAVHASPRETITAFIALLKRERQALAQPQADELEAIAGEKQPLIHALLELDHLSRTAGARALRGEPGLTALLHRAQQLNTTNAMLLTMHRTSCESRLRLIRGGEHSNTLYRASGYLGL